MTKTVGQRSIRQDRVQCNKRAVSNLPDKASTYNRWPVLKWRMVPVHKHHLHRRDARLQGEGETGYRSRGWPGPEGETGYWSRNRPGPCRSQSTKSRRFRRCTEQLPKQHKVVYLLSLEFLCVPSAIAPCIALTPASMQSCVSAVSLLRTDTGEVVSQLMLLNA